MVVVGRDSLSSLSLSVLRTLHSTQMQTKKHESSVRFHRLGPSRALTTGTVGVHGDPTSGDSISSLDGHVLSTQRRFHPHDCVAFYSTEETGRIVSGVSRDVFFWG